MLLSPVITALESYFLSRSLFASNQRWWGLHNNVTSKLTVKRRASVMFHRNNKQPLMNSRFVTCKVPSLTVAPGFVQLTFFCNRNTKLGKYVWLTWMLFQLWNKWNIFHAFCPRRQNAWNKTKWWGHFSSDAASFWNNKEKENVVFSQMKCTCTSETKHSAWKDLHRAEKKLFRIFSYRRKRESQSWLSQSAI